MARNNRIRVDMDNFGRLNIDLCSDVLSRLLAKELLGLKRVCKGWNQLISEHHFSKVQSRKREPISGFFFQGRYVLAKHDINTVTHIPVEFDVTGLQLKNVFSFLPQDVVLLASSDGLFCCRSCYPFKDPAIYVCNPVNKQWIKVNWINPDKEAPIALAFDPSRNPIDDSTNFKLVRVRQSQTESEPLYFSFEIYSSDTDTWWTPQEICQCNDSLYKLNSVYVVGVLHWLTDGDKVLTFNTENELSWLVSVPISAKHLESAAEACIGESNGQLCYVMISENGLQVWLLEDYFEFKWTLQHSKTLEAIEEEHSDFLYNLRERVAQRRTVDSEMWVDPLAFKDGYLLMKVGASIYMYNVETNVMKKVCSVSELGKCPCVTVVPYSLSLVPLDSA